MSASPPRKPLQPITEDTPRGFRDVYWCWIVNEPGFMRYTDTGDVQHCGECGGPLLEMANEHTFVCHVRKPRALP